MRRKVTLYVLCLRNCFKLIVQAQFTTQRLGYNWNAFRVNVVAG